MRRINCINNPMYPLHDRAEPCGLFAEEQLADFAMGRLPDGEKARMEEHRRQCRSCDAMIHEWTGLLGQAAIGIGPVLNDSEGGGEPSANRQAFLHPNASMYSLRQPPRRLRRRLTLSFRLRSFRRKWAADRSRYTFGAIGGLAMILLLGGLFALRPQNWPGEQQSRIERDISHQIHLIQSADTERYAIEPHPPYYGEGTVWLKRKSGEMLIVVDGLHSVVEKDYQIWLQMEDEASSPGILPVQHPQGKTYYHGYGAEEAERLIISLEPKGGSRVQTGPEAVWVEMKR
ncbi:anti-sigma factor [Paenibacillus woosongensis]|uniref:Anti-sigma K factor RskA C-terminal domain-containing protein n=1 Tax=Paenibacillus woosongensis TaxID=307580 RepID=A0A7X2Z0G8_9BACL|nr:anti-sigma factor [Paenibacillus woosongensis]MUG45361.1 hypothetical protein [Paenibacillus woosongensis]